MAWVLYLGNAGQVLYQTGLRGCRTVWCGEGPPDESAKVWSGVRRVKLVVDLIEEEFRLERLPHLTGSDHRALVRRKQRQLFQAEPLVTARRLGRERSGRRDDLILFTAVRGVRVAETWLDWLAGRGIAVGGFWSLPQMAESGLLPCRHQGLRLLPYPCGDRILLRQNYLQEGRLVFSRLSQLPKADFAAGVAEEVERTWRYLLRLLGLAPESGVSLQVAATLTLMEALVEALTDLPGVEVTGLKLSRDLPELAARCLGCRPWRRPDYRLYRFPDKARLARAILYGGAIASMAAASAFAGFVWKETGRLERARQDLVREESRLAD
ncbi:MAG TPA: hypothetical protein ENI90_04370, partial [Methylothermaceae bacterium]|nr:hypothetical protein [Methylothermaceae bacterium]